MSNELSLPVPQILTYTVSQKPHLSKVRAANFDWLAVYFNPAHELPIPMHFYGASEDEVKEKATNWWLHRQGMEKPVAVSTGINSSTKWMHNPVTKDRQRISQNLVAEYLEKGYYMGQGRFT